MVKTTSRRSSRGRGSEGEGEEEEIQVSSSPSSSEEEDENNENNNNNKGSLKKKKTKPSNNNNKGKGTTTRAKLSKSLKEKGPRKRKGSTTPTPPVNRKGTILAFFERLTPIPTPPPTDPDPVSTPSTTSSSSSSSSQSQSQRVHEEEEEEEEEVVEVPTANGNENGSGDYESEGTGTEEGLEEEEEVPVPQEEEEEKEMEPSSPSPEVGEPEEADDAVPKVEENEEEEEEEEEKESSAGPRRSQRSRKLVSYFQMPLKLRKSSSSSRSPSPEEDRRRKRKRREPENRKRREPESRKKRKNVLSPNVQEFLRSGLPDVVEKRRAKSRKTEEIEIGDESEEESSSSEEEVKPKRKLRKGKSLRSYFRDETSSSDSDDDFCTSSSKKKEKKVEEAPKKVMDPATRAFLDSGVPEIVEKAKKVVEKKRVEDDYLCTVGFFPKILSTVGADAEEEEEVQMLRVPQGFLRPGGNDDDEDVIPPQTDYTGISDLLKNSEFEEKVMENRRKVCCQQASNLMVSSQDLGIRPTKSSIPWVEETSVVSLHELCCDQDAIQKLTDWLKLWKSDIKDDGGASRKLEPQRRRQDSDSDSFVTSDEEEGDLRKKSVLLLGPPGSGKTTAVYAAAKSYGFQVVEVNFSSRRQGKDVLHQVEEAVLSQRLKSNKNCLLLFEDIDLIDPKEDEGFHPAVAQLITNAVRPIVMTSSCLQELRLDPKLEKKDPLCIYFEYPEPRKLVDKVLVPVLKKLGSSSIPSKVLELMEMVCRHGKNDIRQVINQLQFLFTFNDPVEQTSSQTVHQHSTNPPNLIQPSFIRPVKKKKVKGSNNCDDEEDEDDLNISKKARAKKSMKKLDSIAQTLTFLCDLDTVDSLQRNTSQEEDEEDVAIHIRNLKSDYCDSNFSTAFSKSMAPPHLLQALVIDNDKEVSQRDKGTQLFHEIGEYCLGWESASFVRSIIKQNVMDSLRLAKRNGRVTSYFNRLDRAFTNRVCETFGFHELIEEAKQLNLKE